MKHRIAHAFVYDKVCPSQYGGMFLKEQAP